LGLSEGFSHQAPTLIFAVTAILSMQGLGMAIRYIPLGTAYAVWVRIGAALTVAGPWSLADAPNFQAILAKLAHDHRAVAL
jgi:quaternary ammonium compound-resistance protein SugE